MTKKIIFLVFLFSIFLSGCARGPEQVDLPALITSEEAKKEVSAAITENNADEEAEKLLKEIDNDLD